MKRLFVDMDGVLSDFDKRYIEMFGMTPREVRDWDKAHKDHNYTDKWIQFVNNKGFATLDKHQGADVLVDYLKQLHNVQICILTSAGGFDMHREVQKQKLKWLDKVLDVKWPAVVVPGRKYKAGFASGDAFIIDDTPDVVKSFCENGGNGIVHTDAYHTVSVLQRWLTPI